MAADKPELLTLMLDIASGDTAKVLQTLGSSPSLAVQSVVHGAARGDARDYFLDDISHYVYAGDTALHIAAAGYRIDLLRAFVAAGAAVDARNRRGAEPLHYAADSHPGTQHWNPAAQGAAIAYLIEAGADPNAADGSKVRPLHRAVRTRGAAAVRALLDGGADPSLPNKNGSTARDLATRTTGRGGSGSPDARDQQAEILELLQAFPVS